MDALPGRQYWCAYPDERPKIIENFLRAVVEPHSTLGTRICKDGVPYRQGATFGEDGEFEGRTDVTDHGRPENHPDPHFHPALSPNQVGQRKQYQSDKLEKPACDRF